jgi:uncharacterized membrane protein YheB (UPF0754 family)
VAEMNEILLNHIVRAILGGASGYITNDYAINMLFKEYTPFKLGGVIKKTRNEFIENLSSMIENDIIDKEKLHGILNSDEFKDKFDILTRDFYENCLYDLAGDDKFSDIDGFDSTLKGLDIFVAEILNDNLENLIGLIADNFNAGCFLTSIQSDNIAASIYASFGELFKNTEILEKIIKIFYEANKELKLSDIFAFDMPGIDNLVNKAVEITAANADPEIFLSFDAALSEALNVFYEKQIKDIIKIDKEKAASLFSRAEVHSAVYKVYRSLLSYGKGLNKTLYSIIDPAFERSLKKYIKDNLPYISEHLVGYVQKNSRQIDRIIEDSIDQVLNEAEGLRAKLLKSFKNAYFDNLSKKYGIVDKIISYIKQFAGSEKLSIQISNKIIEGLDTITISEIVTAVESNFNIDRGYDILKDYMNKNGAVIIESLENYFGKLKVKDILPRFDLTVEKVLSSGTVREFLKNKSRHYLESVMSKELKILLGEDNLDAYVKKASDYLKEKYWAEGSSIKTYIREKIGSLDIEGNRLKSKELTGLIHKGAYAKYKNEALKLRDLNLSLALDKLNSIENITENSSETIRRYTINNSDIILKGSVKGIVSDNLNKLTDDELVGFANDFIGRELKPIMFFGGVLGVIAGLILAGVQNSPLDPSEINFANMATYAFVGFITNVIAINMIFKPYKEIKMFSEIPFLRNFSLGYIVKNQKNFAKSTAYYIDTNLLSKKSINELFERHKDKIKDGFIESIAEDDFAALGSLLMKNREGIIRGTFNFLSHTALKNLSALSNYLYEMISRAKLSSLLSDKSIENLSNFIGGSIKTDDISKGLYSAIRSEKKLKSIFSMRFINELLRDKAGKLYDGIINFMKPSVIKAQIIKYEDKYIKKTDKTIEEVFNENDVSRFSEKINEAVFSEAFKNNVSSAVIATFNKLFERDKTFEELFDGRIKAYIDRNLPQILNKALQIIKDNLAENKAVVSASLRAEFKASLGFIEGGFYAFVDGDKLIDDLVGKIMTEKLPVFMQVKKHEINEIMSDFINNRFYKARVEVLYTGLNKLQINEVIERYLSANKEKLKSKIDYLLLELYNKTKGRKLNDTLDLFNLKDPGSFIKSYESEINAFSDTLYSYLTDNKDKTKEDIFSFASSAAAEFMDLRFGDIFFNFTRDDIYGIGKNISHILDKDDGIKKVFEFLIKEYRKYNKDICLDHYINRDEFKCSAQMFVQKLLINYEAEKELKQILNTIFDSAVNCNFNFIDSRSKEYTVNIFAESSIEALKRNMDDILKTVEFDKIAEEEIEKMEPEKIHQMFNSFAGKYFRALMLYGIGGFVFGINMYVGFSLTGLKILSETLNKRVFADAQNDTKGR